MVAAEPARLKATAGQQRRLSRLAESLQLEAGLQQEAGTGTTTPSENRRVGSTGILIRTSGGLGPAIQRLTVTKKTTGDCN